MVYVITVSHYYILPFYCLYFNKGALQSYIDRQTDRQTDEYYYADSSVFVYDFSHVSLTLRVTIF